MKEHIRTLIAIAGFIMAMWGGCSITPWPGEGPRNNPNAVAEFMVFAVGLTMFGLATSVGKK
jgi:hypothetical protein